MFKKLSAGLLALLLTGCSAVEIVRELPPVELLRDCQHPEVDVTTNGKLAQGLLDYKKALSLCNVDKAALREWSKEDL